MISLYDTASQQVIPLKQRDKGKVSLYVCGPTVYDAPHIGHGRFVLVYDILRRYLIWTGLDVNFVSNITDIDDKIIDRANSEDSDIFTVAKKWEQVWWQTMDSINVLRPDETPHATDYVAQMINLISDLIVKEKAYVIDDGVYLSVDSVPDYGLLAHQSLDELKDGAGDREVVGTEKRNVADFALWKFSKKGEPSWPSPWGDGRPGWHTECVVMSLDLLGEGFDLHTGGLDLKFPHHENERAQAVADGKIFAQHWMHNGFVESGGEKMSKSIGNTLNLVEITDKYDPRAYRLLIMQTHYRSPIEVTDETLVAAGSALDRLDALNRRGSEYPYDELRVDPVIVEKFKDSMNNDLDTVSATELIFNAVKDANTAFDENRLEQAEISTQTVRLLCNVMGLELKSNNNVPEEIQNLVNERLLARKNRDFDLADGIRDRLLDLGWVVEDKGDDSFAHLL